jgi:rhodanese-related sulfurtransferase
MNTSTSEFVVIDVRSEMEFMGGNVNGSINIPLQDVPDQLEYLKSLSKPIVFCCASGGRSGVATSMGLGAGLNCVNGGSWLSVNAQVVNNDK